MKSGSSSTGSIRLRNVRRGSTPEMTVAAAISVPSASAMPVTAPSFTRICCTCAPVRISAPASRAASAIARVTAPGPPTAVTLLPPGAGSIAAARSSTAPVPADQGPIAVP